MRTRSTGHPRITPNQRLVLEIIRSFKRPASEREIKLRLDRVKARRGISGQHGQ